MFGGNGSPCATALCAAAPTVGSNNDFGVGLFGNSSSNVIERNTISGNSNGILIEAGAVGQYHPPERRGSPPPSRVSRTDGPIGFDIKHDAATNVARNAFDRNWCVLYPGPAPAPCPNLPAVVGTTVVGITATPDTLWPANQEMVPVTIEVNVSDDSDAAPVCQISDVTSNELLTASDWAVTRQPCVSRRPAPNTGITSPGSSGTRLAPRTAAVPAGRCRLLTPTICLCWLLLPADGRTQSQTATAIAAGSPPSFRWNLSNTTRLESWHFFEPPPTGGNPDYAFIANRLRAAAIGTWSRIDFGGSVQYVQFGNLPTGATGPGALGTGALYYTHSGRTDSHGVYLRTLFARARLPGNVTLQAGRLPYQSGAEAPSGRPRIESIKRARIDSRLIGEFEWSLYQRTFDGVRGDIDRKPWHLSAAWFRPTQGGFEEDAGTRLGGVDFSAGTFTLRPSVAAPATELGFFVMGYRDDRPVTARPDNTAQSAERVDIGMTTFGATAVGSAAAGNGDADWLFWLAAQTGSWYMQDHRAWSLALEAGYQWKRPWQPWIRGGFLHASGDPDPADNRHGTFFPMLPTVRKYAFTTAYAPMNLQDAFVELIVRPAERVAARADVRRLWLAEATDLWYSGSGPTQQSGSIFGYAGRRSGNSADLGNVIEGSADVSLGRHWSVNGFVGAIHGGSAVAATFNGDWLTFAYLENLIQF